MISATPIVEGQALLTNESGAAVGGLIRGIARKNLEGLPSVANHIVAGSLAQFGGDDTIAIGIGLAQSLGVSVGGRVTLVSPQGAATVLGTIPRIRSYQVVAIFQVGMNEYDSSFVFLPLQAAQVFFQKPNEATQIQVSVQHPDAVGGIDRAIYQALPGQPIRIIDWTEANDSFFAAVTVERNVMFLILTLIILVAAFNIISSLIMMVKDKTRDIAILRTIGAGRGRGDAHLSDVRGVGRHRGNGGGHRARRGLLPQHRHHQGLAAVAHRDQPLQPGGLLPRAASGRARLGRGGAGDRDGARALAARDTLSELAGGAHRPRRSAPA